MNILAIITARGGSKGIKNKNLYPLNGKPLIYYTINSAIKSRFLKNIVLSTDSLRIKNYVKKFKQIDIPFLRPKRLAGDNALTLPVLKYTLLKYEKIIKKKFDYVLLLQPTCPLRSSYDIDTAIELLLKKKVDSVISVTDVGANHPLRMKKILPNGKLSNFIKQKKIDNMMPRQALPKAYIRNGAIYITSRKLIMKNFISSKDTIAYSMPEERSINIDGLSDITLAKSFISK